MIFAEHLRLNCLHGDRSHYPWPTADVHVFWNNGHHCPREANRSGVIGLGAVEPEKEAAHGDRTAKVPKGLPNILHKLDRLLPTSNKIACVEYVQYICSFAKYQK